MPEIARYAAGALELLFRGRLDIAAANGTATVTAHDLRARPRQASALFADVAGSPRRLRARARRSAPPATAKRSLEVALPAGARHVAAVFRGVDAAGEPVVVVQEQTIK